MKGSPTEPRANSNQDHQINVELARRTRPLLNGGGGGSSAGRHRRKNIVMRTVTKTYKTQLLLHIPLGEIRLTPDPRFLCFCFPRRRSPRNSGRSSAGRLPRPDPFLARPVAPKLQSLLRHSHLNLLLRQPPRHPIRIHGLLFLSFLL